MHNAMHNSVVYDALAVPSDLSHVVESPCDTLVRIAFWRDKAQETISAFAARLQSDPDAVPALASALDSQLAQTKQILIAGDPASPDTRELLRQVNTRFLPNKILLVADGGAGQQQLTRWLPFVAGVRRVGGRATAYICEKYVCKQPTTDARVVAQLLSGKN